MTNGKRQSRPGTSATSIAMAALAVVLSYMDGEVLAVCPNMCNGHGECGLENVCECEAGWDLVADCSLKECPTGVSWGSKAYDENTAHVVMECSNVGVCDRVTGSCSCPSGYTGSACQRLACPNDCSGRGTCATLGQAAEFYGVTRYGGVGSFVYTNWEADMVMTCICDWGYTGGDCSLRMCPKGDDPVTTLQESPRVAMTVNATDGVMEGNFVLTFQGESFAFPANTTQFDSTDCEAAFEGLGNLEDVTCSRGDVDADGGTTFDIAELVAFPTFPHQNNVFSHDGWPGLDAFSCDAANVTGATDPVCKFTVLQDDNLKEYEFCSRRGICDFETGRCDCVDGFSRANCDVSESQITEDLDADVLELYTTLANFTGNVLYLKTERESSSYFNLIKAASEGENTFVLAGDGTLRMYKVRELI
ncbi:unnamed protein product [Ectocarpus sp. 12 AP-2014]